MKIWYHGTSLNAAKSICNNGIDLSCSQNRLDFGVGFYTTPDYDAAVRWAKRKTIRRNEKAAVVSVYVDYDKALPLIHFVDSDDLEWGQFCMNNRNGYEYVNKIKHFHHNLDAKYAIIYGRISDLAVVDTSDLLKINGELLTDLSSIFNPSYPFQYSFHTEKAISCIIKMNYRNL